MFLPRFISLLLGLAALASAQDPLWIWHTAEAKDGEVRFFRKTFTLAAVPAEATLSVSCDNRAKVLLNGVEVGRSDTWQQPVKARVEKQLKAGENVLAIRGTNEDGVAALVARLEVKAADGVKVALVSDTSWLASDKETAGWEKAGFATTEWAKTVSRAKLGDGPWGDVLSGKPSIPAPAAAVARELKTLPGFKAELVRTAEFGEGSWVSMAVDPKGRIIVSSQSKPSATWGGLMRFTLGPDGQVAKSERLDTAIGGAMGLLWAFDSLYVDGNGPSGYGLYRLRFKDDQPAGDAEFLYKGADGEHGSHGLVLGPDGQLYLMAGNHTDVPKQLKATSPLKGWAEDHLLPRQWDANGHAVGIMTPGGHVLRSADQGKTWEIFAGSFRNAYDLAFNADGELFTYDSDMEWDIGAPWYRPTRINHLVSGGEYGWRSGTSNEPAYYPDSLPAVVDIGIGSPTGVRFGTGAKFPSRYQQAFYALDWANGKLFAVHLKPNGSGYTGEAELFIEGKPLNITDLEIVNGDMYFTCGGRGTQAALYRVSFTDRLPADKPFVDTNAAAARQLRQTLEKFHGRQDAKAVEAAWPHLDSPDRFLRWAARTAIEFQPVASWQARALAETRPQAALEAMLALIRAGSADAKTAVLQKLSALPLAQLNSEQQLAAIRIAGLVFTRLGAPTAEERTLLVNAWAQLFPRTTPLADAAPKWLNAGPFANRIPMRESERFNREMALLLTFLDAPGTVEKSMALLRTAPSQEEQMYYAFILRNGHLTEAGNPKAAGPLAGWTPALRREYFTWFLKADRDFNGGASFKKFLSNIKNEATATLNEADKTAVADLLMPAAVIPVTAASEGHPRGFVKAWTLDELTAAVGSAKTDAARGQRVYTEAQCALCHRFGEGGGAVGPDLTGVGSRFNRRDLLEAILDPSKVVSDQYRNLIVSTKSGREIIGRQVDDTPAEIALAENPFSADRTSIAKADITQRAESLVSPMPPGLLNLFSKDEVADLLTYLEGGGK